MKEKAERQINNQGEQRNKDNKKEMTFERKIHP